MCRYTSLCIILILTILKALKSQRFSIPDINEEVTTRCLLNYTGNYYKIIAWTQVVGMNNYSKETIGSARTIIYGGDLSLECPLISFNNNTNFYDMKKRNNIINKNCFPVMVCEFEINSFHQNIVIKTIDGSLFPIPSLKNEIYNISIIGDTGKITII
jgi:hypothetical protein